ncbi:glycogen biosynthesis protein GlgD [Gottfriedia sp. NPDC056225]|uniref:glycogen biosynthesis protein GlgD n=1 Tax=Gottfriedia sp. NPDC056225 TaxID=3345751 RepID=UPI0015585E6D|nr:glycogen biosynthesis protein GlgD [Arthrobacter citreus]
MQEYVQEYAILGRKPIVVKKKSKSNNPEQTTKNKTNTEFSNDLSAVDQVKINNAKKGQPQRSQQG